MKKGFEKIFFIKGFKCLFIFLFLSVYLIQATPLNAEEESKAESHSDVKQKKKRVKRSSREEHAEEVKPTKPTLSTLDSYVSSADESIQVALVLDNSRSMNKTDPNRLRDQGAKLFLQFLEPSDYFSVVQFGEDAKIVAPFNQLGKTSSEDISEAFKSINNDGNFTDFLNGLEAAEGLFEEISTVKALNKAIVIVTDGQNDPNPIKHTPEHVRDEILKSKLPSLKRKGIRVFTLAISDLADRKFLSEIAKDGNGLSWYAEGMNDVHKVFSDLYLTLKKPQALELTKDGFEIENTTTEATFFVNRKLEKDSILVVDPSGKEFSNTEFPTNWKWFRGAFFDLITIPKPLAGRWTLSGNDKDLTGYAKLITNLNLEHDWPEGTLDIGNTLVLKVRLTGDTEVLNDPQIKDLIFYSYKFINNKTGAIYLQGKLNDNSESGDEHAGDKIYSASITLNDEGSFKLYISAIGPTFVRQVHLPVSITRGLISLEHIPENTFSHAPEKYLVKLHGDSLRFKNRKISLIAALGDNPDTAYGVKIDQGNDTESEFEVDLNRLKEGTNKVIAVVSGVDTHGKEQKAKSEELIIEVKAHVVDDTHAEEIVQDSNIPEIPDVPEEGHVEVKEKSKIDYFGAIGPFLTLLIGMFLARHFIKRSKQEKGVSIVIRPEYKVENSLAQQVERLVSKASKSRKRALRQEEIEIFSELPELTQMLTDITEKIHAENEAELTQAAISQEETVIIENPDLDLSEQAATQVGPDDVTRELDQPNISEDAESLESDNNEQEEAGA